MIPLLDVKGLEAKLGSFHLGPIDLEVMPGHAMGFIGSNGSGKSSSIDCFLGLRRPDKGTVHIAGHRVDSHASKWKESVGFVLNRNGFFEHLSVWENLAFIGSFYKDWDQAYCSTLMNRLELDKSKPISRLSTGDLAKAAFIAAIAHHPQLLIMDEPTNGLDPVARAEFVQIVSEYLRREETSLFMTSHILSDLSGISDQLVFLKDGKVVEVAWNDHLLEKWRRISFRSPKPLNGLDCVKIESDRNTYVVTCRDGGKTMGQLKAENVEILGAARLTLDEITVHILKGAQG